MMEYLLMPLKRYADFSGRSRRKEYWMFTLGVIIVSVLFSVLLIGTIDPGGGGIGGISVVSIAILVIFSLAIFIPALAV
jgi:uncharacterized membrane protein YhaH (DUF805 family)